MKTVAAISFRDNHSISMDIEAVSGLEASAPIKLEDGNWFCEVIVRSANGIVALQLVADDPRKFQIATPGVYGEGGME